MAAVGMVVALLAFSAPSDAERSACALLPPEQVSAIVGSAVHVNAAESSKAESQLDVCVYRGQDLTIRFSIHTSDSELAARSAFAQHVTEAFSRDTPDRLLRGVGAEARFGTVERTRSGIVVARYDTTVMVLVGPHDQSLLVALARSAIAELSAAPHKADP
jgi:hypothetical protein